MTSEHTQGIVKYYTRRHTQRRDAFDDRPYANYGYWTRPGLSMADAAEAMAGLVAGAAGLCPQDEVLEVGCGYGACAVRYASAFGAKSIVGIDITPTRVEHGASSLSKLASAKSSFVASPRRSVIASASPHCFT